MGFNFFQRALSKMHQGMFLGRTLRKLLCTTLCQQNIARQNAKLCSHYGQEHSRKSSSMLCFQRRLVSNNSYNVLHQTGKGLLPHSNKLVPPSNNYSSSAMGIQKFDNSVLYDYLRSLCEEYSEQSNNLLNQEGKSETELKKMNIRLIYLQPIVARMQLYEEKKVEVEELYSLMSDLASDDVDMMKMAQQDIRVLKEQMDGIESELMMKLVPPEKADHNDIVMEIAAGVGGHEAMLFTKEIYEMYANFTVSMGWHTEIEDLESGEGESIRRVSLYISGQNVYQHLKYEGGVHRVQRVPKHIKPPRIHTSATTVAILPQPSEIDIELHPKDLKITFCRASGAGGQHVNTTDSAVRIVHIPTGTVTECQTGRSPNKNKETALKKLRALLFEKEFSDQNNSIKSSRKLQVATKDRSDKIRTYNFPQDRITDHRIQGNSYGIKDFLNGGEKLREMIEQLQEESRKERLQELIDIYKTKNTSPKQKSSS